MERSETIGQLAAALAAAQGEMGSAIKSSENPYFKSKYADFAAIVEAIKKPLSKNGIAYVQTTDTEDGSVTVETTLFHASGEWLSSELRMRPVKDDPQGIGSCITYARRYGLQAIVGIDADSDDDGNAASAQTAKPKQEQKQAPQQKEESESAPVQAPSQRLEARYGDLVKEAIELDIRYIPLAELTDTKSIEAAGKALASKIKAARDNTDKPAAQQLFPE